MLSPRSETFCRSFKLKITSACFPVEQHRSDAQQLASSCHSALLIERLAGPLRDLATQLTSGELRQRRCDPSVDGRELFRPLRKVFGPLPFSFNFSNPRVHRVFLASLVLQYILVYLLLRRPVLLCRC